MDKIDKAIEWLLQQRAWEIKWFSDSNDLEAVGYIDTALQTLRSQQHEGEAVALTIGDRVTNRIGVKGVVEKVFKNGSIAVRHEDNTAFIYDHEGWLQIEPLGCEGCKYDGIYCPYDICTRNKDKDKYRVDRYEPKGAGE